MKEISDVYVHHHGDGVGGGSLFWLVTLTERYEPIKKQLCCRTDVTVKANRTVTWLLNSTTAKGQKVWLNTGVVLISPWRCSLLSNIIGQSSRQLHSQSKKQHKAVVKIVFLGGGGRFAARFGPG